MGQSPTPPPDPGQPQPQPLGRGLASPIMRAFVRGWTRGRRDKQLVVACWLTMAADGLEPSYRDVARMTGVNQSQTLRWIRAFLRDVRVAQRAEEALGVERGAWARGGEVDRDTDA